MKRLPPFVSCWNVAVARKYARKLKAHVPVALGTVKLKIEVEEVDVLLLSKCEQEGAGGQGGERSGGGGSGQAGGNTKIHIMKHMPWSHAKWEF
jgi:hypothetical protein